MSYFTTTLHEHAKFLGYASTEAFIIKRWDCFEEGTKALLKLANNDRQSLIRRLEEQDKASIKEK